MSSLLVADVVVAMMVELWAIPLLVSKLLACVADIPSGRLTSPGAGTKGRQILAFVHNSVARIRSSFSWNSWYWLGRRLVRVVFGKSLVLDDSEGSEFRLTYLRFVF